MTDDNLKNTRSYSDLKDVVIIFSILILGLVAASLTDFFDRLHTIAANPDGFKIVELLCVLVMIGVALAVFFRRRWKEIGVENKQKDKSIEELMDNINRLRSTVDLSPDATIVHREGQIIFSNKAAVHLFGAVSEEELLGLNVRDLLHYAYRDRVMQRIEQMTKYMKQVPTTDMTIKRLDGSYVDVSVASTPVYYHAIPHIITILRDITERKKAEEIQSQLASIVLTSSDAIYGMSMDGFIQSWNPGAERLYGFSEKDALGNSITMIITPDNFHEVNYILGKVTKGESIESYETKHLKKDKTVIDVSVSVSPIEDASGVIMGASTIARDITFKKRVEEELKKYAEELAMSNEELYVFSYAASHDLQEPLRTIQSFVNLLNEKYKNRLDDEVNEYIEAADDGVSRMYRLITDFLMYSRVGSQSAVMEDVDCDEALKDALANVKVAIKESKAKIKQYSLPSIYGNRLQMTQVFQNLISNAIKYKGERAPFIEISATKRDGLWVFSVTDNGIGIEQWFSERIFIVFQKLHDHKKYPGSGIGLALCKRIVEKHGGKIWFESEVGKGSTFYFTIPDKEKKTEKVL
jgi:PAS domain S-box-containing protein